MNKPTFRIASSNGTTLYLVTIPDTDEGMDMLDEISRMFRHRGEDQIGGRIAGIITERKQELRSPTPGTKSRTTSKQTISEAPETKAPCKQCGQGPASYPHDPRNSRNYHPYTPSPPLRKRSTR